MNYKQLNVFFKNILHTKLRKTFLENKKTWRKLIFSDTEFI